MKRLVYFNLLIACCLLVSGPIGCKKKPKGPTPIPGAQAGPRSAPGTFGPETTTPGGGPGTGAAVPPGEDTRGRDVTGPGPGGPGPGPGGPETPGGIPLPLDEPTGMRRDDNFFKDSTVYFDFDRSAIKATERAKIEAVAVHLKSQPTHKVRVAGHCDERGTEGYNLVLGERRALAIREYLVRTGIGPERVYTISYGEAIPAVEGHDEAAWSKNRRGEFILLTP
jgi:peptidoglycan-associated lipoprotein